MKWLAFLLLHKDNIYFLFFHFFTQTQNIICVKLFSDLVPSMFVVLQAFFRHQSGSSPAKVLT